MNNTYNEEITIPVLPLKGLAVFPNQKIQFDVSRERSVLALTGAMETGGQVFLVLQRDLRCDRPAKED